jgi:predicted  nucleic acid-binding Zn-ribbon protein
MAAEQLQKELSQAREHVIQGRRIVEEQRGRIAQLRAHGHSVKSHEQLLAQFERTLESLQHHERVLMAELAEAENPKGAR